MKVKKAAAAPKAMKAMKSIKAKKAKKAATVRKMMARNSVSSAVKAWKAYSYVDDDGKEQRLFSEEEIRSIRKKATRRLGVITWVKVAE